MKYKHSNYKYQLTADHWARTKIKPLEKIDTGWIVLTVDGRLFIKAGYAWDGCSGPTIDDKTNMVPGLEHDAKYQLMRLGNLAHGWRDVADTEFRAGCKERGMGKIRAWYYYQGVRMFADFATKPGAEPKEIEVD